jgi:hypothetical protein
MRVGCASHIRGDHRPVGSTALSAIPHPEDLRGIIGAYHRCCTDRRDVVLLRTMGAKALAVTGNICIGLVGRREFSLQFLASADVRDGHQQRGICSARGQDN